MIPNLVKKSCCFIAWGCFCSIKYFLSPKTIIIWAHLHKKATLIWFWHLLQVFYVTLPFWQWDELGSYIKRYLFNLQYKVPCGLMVFILRWHFQFFGLSKVFGLFPHRRYEIYLTPYSTFKIPHFRFARIFKYLAHFGYCKLSNEDGRLILIRWKSKPLLIKLTRAVFGVPNFLKLLIYLSINVTFSKFILLKRSLIGFLKIPTFGLSRDPGYGEVNPGISRDPGSSLDPGIRLDFCLLKVLFEWV